MKKYILFAGLYCLQPSLYAGITPICTYALVNGNDRALEHFKANYTEAPDAVWFNMPDNNMYCVFHQDGRVNEVFYDRRGYWRYTLIGYTPSFLVKNVRELVKHNFIGYHICYINEIVSGTDEPVYMINIENAEKIKIIRVKGEEFEVEQDLEKS